MQIPAFSIFSAVSELAVTAGVFFVIHRNWNRRAFPLPLFLTVVLFEALVNVLYMSHRASQAASGAVTIAPAMKLFFAVHGMVSLVAFIVFVVLGVFAYQDQKRGVYFFRERPVLTWTFLVVWMLSIASGEAIFVMRYLL